MLKAFNTTAVCIPSKHYMVDLSERVKEIRAMVDDGNTSQLTEQDNTGRQ